jgi:hypothetical protein
MVSEPNHPDNFQKEKKWQGKLLKKKRLFLSVESMMASKVIPMQTC